MQIPSLYELFFFTKKYQRRFRTKLTEIVTSTTIFFTFRCASTEQYVLAKAPTKIFCFWVAPILQSKDTAELFPQRKVNSSKRKLNSLVDILIDFLKTFNKSSNCLQIRYQNPKVRLDLQKQKAISTLISITMSLNTHIDKFVYRLQLETAISANFHWKCLNCTAFNLLLQKVLTITIAKLTTSTGTDITLQTNVL